MREKKILVTSTDLMMIQFLVPHVIHLSQNGYQVDIACSDVGGRMQEVRDALKGAVRKIHVVRLVRSPASAKNLQGYRDMKAIFAQNHYDIVWTNEPVMGVVTRLAARHIRKQGMKVIYMVHGFHFYKGAPKQNWMMFYPIEKFAGHFCDSVVTVNREDYSRANKMHLPDVRYIHGIGINTNRLTLGDKKNDIRAELGLPRDAFVVLSVGELNTNKNQKTIIEAIALINDPMIHYILCGKGDQMDKLKKIASDLKVSEHTHFLGYRTDVVDICSQADVFAMPSFREGLPVASLEAMYCGLPLVVSNIRGLSDVVKAGESGYLCDNPEDSKAFAEGIEKLKNNPERMVKIAERNKKAVIPYCLDNTKREVLLLMKEIEGRC